MSETKDIRDEIHEMRGDFKTLSNRLAELTEVIIRKEEGDKYLEIRIEKLEKEDEKKERRIRATEDFITKSNPLLTLGSKVLIAVVAAGCLIWLGFK